MEGTSFAEQLLTLGSSWRWREHYRFKILCSLSILKLSQFEVHSSQSATALLLYTHIFVCVYTNSKNSLSLIQSLQPINPLTRNIQLFHVVIHHTHFCWIPSHLRIPAMNRKAHKDNPWPCPHPIKPDFHIYHPVTTTHFSTFLFTRW